MDTFITKYGLITLYKNDYIIREPYLSGGYWDIDTLLYLKQYIDPARNILEIGGHCGTSTMVYSSFLNDKSKIYVYEPQRNMYNLLVKNINQNNLQNKILPHNLGVFCYNGDGIMNNIDFDGNRNQVKKAYKPESHLLCNFGAVSLGTEGESIKMTTIDNMNIDNIGFIHCDAEGSENFIFSHGIDTIKKHRPVILYENNFQANRINYHIVCKAYPQYKKESTFDLKKFCMEELNYSKYIDNFNGSIDTLLIP